MTRWSTPRLRLGLGAARGSSIIQRLNMCILYFKPKRGQFAFWFLLMIVQYLPSVAALAIFLASCSLGLLFCVLSSIVYCLNFIWSYLNPLNSISGFGYADSLQWHCCTNTLSNPKTIFLEIEDWKHPCHQTRDKLISSISSDLLRLITGRGLKINRTIILRDARINNMVKLWQWQSLAPEWAYIDMMISFWSF